MRHEEHIVESPEDGQPCALREMPEDAEHLLRQRVLRYAVMVIQSGLCRPADEERTGDVGLCPFEDFRDFVPVTHLLVIKLFDRSPCDDHAVELLCLEDFEILVEQHHVFDGRILRCVAFKAHEHDFELQRSIGEQSQQVGLCGNLQRHEVEDDDAQRTDILCGGTRVVHHEDILLFEQVDGG